MTQNPFIPDYDDPPAPPPVLYKYVAPERVDVLENSRIRFTPLMGTNDLFEVRQTFERIAGPRFRAALFHETDVADIDGMIVQEFQKLGLDLDTAAKLGLGAAQAYLGDGYADVIRNQTKGFADLVMGKLNGSDNVERMLDRMGSGLLALSLSEQADSAVMWAHYAGNSAGFVIAFDTANPFFSQAKSGKSRTVHQIVYFDGKVDEMMDDLRACLISKTADWSYEREWRVYVKVEDIDEIIQVGDEDIHLMEIPAGAITRVIVGNRASPETIDRLRQILNDQYPNVLLTKMHPDRRAAKLIEVPIP